MTEIRYLPRPRWRQSDSLTREKQRLRNIVVALEPTAVLVRAKGLHAAFRIPMGVLYQLGARLEADRRLLEKKSRRSTQRITRGKVRLG